MKIVAISAANITVARGHSASTHACELIRDSIASEQPDASVEIVPLIDYDLKPCRMCSECFDAGKCVRDEAFNTLYEKLIAADAIFLVCPHYAPLPSKVMIVLEKLQEMMFIRSCDDPTYHFPLSGKPLGIVAHGGQTDEAMPYYKTALLDPLANAFSSIGLCVVDGEQWANGVTFGVKSITKPAESRFVTIEHDWDAIHTRIAPLVHNVVTRLGIA
jgi:multimeric flavodoxin WrbA